ncbi:MAG TPA: cyclic nucleotide-binding domain-containing protein, partial [Nitrospirae bacterium]|nr:cyclic nucleotide-binding domain-containing protein [Nitrospirota bacterium]
MATVKESLPSSLRIFTNLSEKELASIYNSLPSKRLKAKEILIKEGSPVSCLFVAVSGQIEALKEIDGANISIGYLERNTVYGSLVQEKDMVLTVILIANESTTVLCIDEKALILVKPDIKVKLLLYLSLIHSKMILATTDYTIKDKQKVIDMCRIKEKEYEAGREIIASSDK